MKLTVRCLLEQVGARLARQYHQTYDKTAPTAAVTHERSMKEWSSPSTLSNQVCNPTARGTQTVGRISTDKASDLIIRHCCSSMQVHLLRFLPRTTTKQKNGRAHASSVWKITNQSPERQNGHCAQRSRKQSQTRVELQMLCAQNERPGTEHGGILHHSCKSLGRRRVASASTPLTTHNHGGPAVRHLESSSAPTQSKGATGAHVTQSSHNKCSATLTPETDHAHSCTHSKRNARHYATRDLWHRAPEWSRRAVPELARQLSHTRTSEPRKTTSPETRALSSPLATGKEVTWKGHRTGIAARAVERP